MRLFGLLVFLACMLNMHAQDAQWRGPERSGIYPESGLLNSWPAGGPEKLFVAGGLGRGYSSAVVAGQQIYVTGIKDSQEILSALDLEGNLIWQQPTGPCWTQSFPEARSTPTVDGERVYILTALDRLVCMDVRSGEEIWAVDLHAQYGSSWDMFGVSESVLLVDDLLITTPMGEQLTALALDKFTGKEVWRSAPLGGKRSNMSPILIKHCGKSYVLAASQTHMLSIDPENGELTWRYHYNKLLNGENQTILANTPLYNDSCLWISNGWDIRSVMLEIAPDGRSVKEKFTDITFDNQNHGQVLVDGYVYGSNFTGRNSGKWVCMKWDTGEIMWIGDFHNKGPVIYADRRLYILDEKKGNMGLVLADPEKFELLSSFRITDGKGPFWSRPTIYDRVLYVRHGEKLIAYNIRSTQNTTKSQYEHGKM